MSEMFIIDVLYNTKYNAGKVAQWYLVQEGDATVCHNDLRPGQFLF